MMIESSTSAAAEIPDPCCRTITRLWMLAAVLVACGLLALTVDTAVARTVNRDECALWIMKLGSFGEMFGHGMGIALILGLIFVLDPARRISLGRIAAASLGSGLLANALKLLLTRVRPAHFDLQLSSVDSFGGWLPLLSNPSAHQSFPSSHSAVAAGLAIVLTAYYPRGRWMFPVFAAAACMQRIIYEAHYLSDVFWGAAIGCLFAPLCVYGGPVTQVFDRLEALVSNRFSPQLLPLSQDLRTKPSPAATSHGRMKSVA